MSVAALERRLRAVAGSIPEPDREAERAARAALDAKTKPRGSLGRLEELACRVAGIRGTAELGPLPATIVVAAGDHGVAAEGVSAYPSEVTRQMLANFAAGGAAINVLARSAGAELLVVDAGVTTPIGDAAVFAVRVGAGTRNLLVEPAMTRGQALEAVAAGLDIARDLDDRGVAIVGLGEMGIGNSTSAAALTAALLGRDAATVCGRGTGLDDAALACKVDVVRSAVRRRRVDRRDPVGALAALGGFEIGVLAGLAIGAAAARLVVLLDGFIASAGALVAAAIEPRTAGATIAAHLSPEPGHRVALEALGLDPLLDLGLRLGEGTGAALALPVIQASLAILAEMATFAGAGVTDAGR